jgi:glycosyltransferase involved in cell wall biosynthesis
VAAFEELSEKLGIRERVVFTGHRRDVAACMRAFDVLVHPTLSEAFGQVLVEAMSVGTPVIATRIGGISEIIDDGRDGILIEPRDADALAAAILDLHERPSRRRELGVEGSARARSHFSATRMVDEQLASYRRHLPASHGGNHTRRA